MTNRKLPSVSKLLKHAIRFILMSPLRFLAIRIMALVCAHRTTMISPPMATGKNTSRILVLSPGRFSNDLTELVNTGKYEIFSVPSSWQFAIFRIFYNDADVSELVDYAHHRNQPNLMESQFQLRRFLKDFLGAYYRRMKIDCVISANFWYRQDIHWGAVSKKIGVPYVVFFKEGFRTQEPDQTFMLQMCEKIGGKFEGTFLAAQNRVIRDLFVNSGFSKPDQTGSLGIPRMDRFVKNISSPYFEDLAISGDEVTLFSFNPGIGLLEAGIPPWPDDSNAGWSVLFVEVHTAFGRLALSRPDIQFNIKLKWQGEWRKSVEKCISAGGASDCSNISIFSEGNAHQLIRNSRVVCSFNSSTMLEAGLMGKAVIVPHFEKAIPEKLKPYVKFRNRDDIFQIARSPSELQAGIQSALTSTKISKTVVKLRQKEFEKWLSPLDGNALENWCDCLDRLIEKEYL
jgi:hypothetical protein